MTETRFTRVQPDSQSPIPIHRYDEAEARSAWEDYQRLCQQEDELRRKRLHAHQRFVAAFTAGGAA